MGSSREALEQAFAEYDENEKEEVAELSDVSEPVDEPVPPEIKDEIDSEKPDEPPKEKPSRVDKFNKKFENFKGKPEVKADKPEEKAPASWSPKSREGWAQLPAETRAQILKRENEVNKVLKDTAVARQAVDQLNQTLAPYREGLIAAGARTPFEAIDVLLRTEATLRAGSATGKAQMIANLINQYGVDIGVLDDLLVGNKPKQSNEFEQLLDQRLAPFNQFLQQQQWHAQNEMYQQEYRATESVGEFAKTAEFFNDVRHDMADFLDLASKNNRIMSLQEAYERACAIHPEISKVMQQRAEQQRIMGTQQQIAQKKAAAVSVTGRRVGDGNAKGSMSRRDLIADAWDELS